MDRDHDVDVLDRVVVVAKRAFGFDLEVPGSATDLLRLCLPALHDRLGISSLGRPDGSRDSALTDGAVDQPGKQNAENGQADAQALLPRSHSVGTG